MYVKTISIQIDFYTKFPITQKIQSQIIYNNYYKPQNIIMKITYGNIGILRYKFAYFIAFYYFCTQIPDIATYKRIKSDYIYQRQN